MRKALLLVALIGGAFALGNAFATPSSGVTAETVRGPLTKNLKFNTHFANGSKVKVQTKGDVELIVQRIEAAPGATFGWHTHPGENVNVIKQGTITLYHDESCTQGTSFGAGTTFTTSPSQVHLAKNLSASETLVLFAVYLAPRTTPLQAVRIDQPLPAPGCPQ